MQGILKPATKPYSCMFVLATFMCFLLVLFDYVLILFNNLGFKVCDSPMSLLALVVESTILF